MGNEITRWKEINELMSNPSKDYSFRLHIEYISYWRTKPNNHESMKRNIMEAHIRHAIDRFLEKPENVAKLMEWMLRSDNKGELTTPEDDNDNM